MECLTCPNVAINHTLSYVIDFCKKRLFELYANFPAVTGQARLVGGGLKLMLTLKGFIFRYIDRFIYRDGISVIVGYIVLIDNN